MLGSEAFLAQLRGRTAAPSWRETTTERPKGPVVLHVSEESGVGGAVWEAAAVLADYIGDRCGGKRVLELGSGTGALGLFLAQQGSASVTLTDRPELLPLLRGSVAANVASENAASEGRMIWRGCALRVESLSWGDDFPELGPIDWVVASEVVYNGLLYSRLEQTLQQLFAKCGLQRMVMAYERRGSEAQWEGTMRRMFAVVQLSEIMASGRCFVIMECSEPRDAAVSE